MEKVKGYAAEVRNLIDSQANSWPLMANNYKDLEKVKVKMLEYPDFYIKLQFNPARIRSTAAKVDKQTIEKRPCFLCNENRPPEQDAIQFHDQFLILVNPFPIFPEHLTITHKQHVSQLIKDNFRWMLALSKELPDFTIFYNGPRCGASAPDHFHFQAGMKNYMPLDYQLNGLKLKFGKLQTSRGCKIWKINDLIRKYILIESKNEHAIESAFENIYERLAGLRPYVDEPDLNLHCLYEENGWKVLIFPRGEHRPWQFYAEGEQNILFSPASVDLGGLLIIPLEKDFEKIEKVTARNMMKQIGISDELFNKI